MQVDDDSSGPWMDGALLGGSLLAPLIAPAAAAAAAYGGWQLQRGPAAFSASKRARSPSGNLTKIFQSIRSRSPAVGRFFTQSTLRRLYGSGARYRRRLYRSRYVKFRGGYRPYKLRQFPYRRY